MRTAILLLIVALTTCAAPQRPARAEKEAKPEAAKAKKEASFPDSWIGKWRGKLDVWGGDGKRQTLHMDFEVAKTDEPDRYRWVIQYQGQPKRNYELVVRDAEKGQYAIDEKNTIVIPAQYVAGDLISVFSVMGNHLAFRYRMVGEEIVLDVIMTKVAPTGKTGGEGRIPTVSHYGVRNVQRATLERVKK
jgi:hypothetical protein